MNRLSHDRGFARGKRRTEKDCDWKAQYIDSLLMRTRQERGDARTPESVQELERVTVERKTAEHSGLALSKGERQHQAIGTS